MHEHDWQKSFTGRINGIDFQYYKCDCGERKMQKEEIEKQIDTSKARRNRDFFSGLRMSK